MFATFRSNKILTSLLSVLLVVAVIAPIALTPLEVAAEPEGVGAVEAWNESGKGLAVTSAAADGNPQSSEKGVERDAEDFGCFGSDGANAILGCLGYITYLAAMLVAWLAGLVSVLLNYIVLELVVRMGAMFGTEGSSGESILLAWGAVRDIANVFLVFLTLWIGIATILGVSRYGAKQLLWKVILAALFVNFSVTLTKFVIDVSNIAAAETFLLILDSNAKSNTASNMQDPEACLAAGGSEPGSHNPCMNVGLTGIFWNQFRAQQLWDISTITDAEAGEITDRQQQMFLMSFMMIILFAIMLFVFGSAALILLTRFVVLVFLIILSPIALVMWITNVSNAGNKWWQMLINQSLVAPAMFLMWWISLVLMNGMNVTQKYTEKGTLGQATLANLDSLTVLVFFAIVAGFLIASLVVAKSLGAVGANAAMNVGKRWSRNAAAGMGGFMYANTAGRISERMAERHNRKMAEAQRVDEETGEYRDKGRLAGIRRKLANTKFDRGMQTALEAPSKHGVLGTSSRSQRKAATTKAYEARGATLNEAGRQNDVREAAGIVAAASGGNAEGYSQEEVDRAKHTISQAKPEDLEAVRKEGGSSKRTFRNEAVREAQSKKQLEARANSPSATPAERHEAMNRAYKDERAALQADSGDKTLVAGMTPATIEKNSSQFMADKENVRHVSANTYSTIMENKNGVFSEADLKAAEQERHKNIHAALSAEGSPEEVARAIKQDIPDNKGLENLPPETYANPNFVAALKPSEYRYLTKDRRSNFSNDQLAGFDTQWKKKYKDMIPTADPASSEYAEQATKLKGEIGKMSAKDIAGLGDNFVSNPEVIKNYNSKTLAELVKNDVNIETRNKIQSFVENEHNKIQSQQSGVIQTVSGEPASRRTLSPEERNIEDMHKWFNGGHASV